MDDASTDGTARWVEAHDPPVRLVRLPKNGGFCAAANAGLEAARGPYIQLLNNDTEVTPGWLEAGLAPFADPTVGSGRALGSGPLQPRPGRFRRRRLHSERLAHQARPRPARLALDGTSARRRLRRQWIERLLPCRSDSPGRRVRPPVGFVL